MIHFFDGLLLSCAALNETLKDEIQHFKMLTGQAMSNGGSMMNFPTSFTGSQLFNPNNQAMHNLLTTQQFQQLQIHSQKQHQYQQHQLHQLQQQQDLTQLSQLSGDFKMRPSMPLPKENASESRVPKD